MTDTNIDTTAAEAALTRMVEEALELRHGEAGDPEGRLSVINPDEGPSAVSHMLLRVRLRSDRVDFLLSGVTRLRGAARRTRDNARYESELAYNTATNTNENRRTREYVTGAERHAQASLDSLVEKRAAFLADRLVSVADESYEVILQVHRQLGDMRTDLRSTIRELQFESGLER